MPASGGPTTTRPTTRIRPSPLPTPRRRSYSLAPIVGVLVSCGILAAVLLGVLHAFTGPNPFTPTMTRVAGQFTVTSAPFRTNTPAPTNSVVSGRNVASPMWTIALPTWTVQPRPSTDTPRPAVPTPIPLGVYVTNVRMEPPRPNPRESVIFYVTFLNTGGEQEFRWFVFVYKEGQNNPIGQTSSDADRILPPGISEQPALNNWKMGPGEPCTNFYAQVHWLDPVMGKPFFKKPDGQPYILPFTLCP